MGKASSSRGWDRTSKCSTSNTKSPTSKASLPHSLEDKPHLRYSTKARAMTKVNLEQNPRQRQWKQYYFFHGEKKGHVTKDCPDANET
jgi:hypothetical protein